MEKSLQERGCGAVGIIMGKTLQGREPLAPRRIINVKGKVHYSESGQAWNTIKLKTEFLNEFQQLKEKRSKFSYELAYHRNPEEFLRAIKKMVKSGQAMPLMIWLFKDK